MRDLIEFCQIGMTESGRSPTESFRGTFCSIKSLDILYVWSPIRSRVRTILPISAASHLEVPSVSSILDDSRICPICRSMRRLSASTCLSRSAVSSRIYLSPPDRPSMISRIWELISKYMRLMLEWIGISDGLSRVTISMIRSLSFAISTPRVL